MTGRQVAKAAARPFLLVVWLLSGLMPRDRRRWVFGSWYGKRFADNSKWLYLHCANERGSEVKVTWISLDREIVATLRRAGHPAAYGWSLAGIWACLRAGVLVCDVYTNDLNYWFTCRAKRVNLWHGIPLKRIERDIGDPDHFIRKGHAGSLRQRLYFRYAFPWMANRFHMMASSSRKVSELIGGAFGIPPEDLPVTGFPRSDPLLDPDFVPGPWDADVCGMIEALREAGKRVVAYMPTFRDQAARSGRSLPIDWAQLAAVLERGDAVLLLKLHSGDRVHLPDLPVDGPIRVLDDTVDVYPVLRLVDLLITDYSSIYFDFLLLGRPMLFYCFDLDHYQRYTRGFYGKYSELTPGPKLREFPQLLAAIAHLIEKAPEEIPEHVRAASLLDDLHAYRDAGSASRCYEAIRDRFVDRGVAR